MKGILTQIMWMVGKKIPAKKKEQIFEILKCEMSLFKHFPKMSQKYYEKTV